MKVVRRLISAWLMAAPLVLHAQSAINSGASAATEDLPLRNLQIEVRQLNAERNTRERLDAGITAQSQPGQSSLALDLELQARQGSRNGTSQQRVLVLNGRRATIRLGNGVPLRLLQSFQHQGRWIIVPGTVWLQADTGFAAVPRWTGNREVELELQTLQGRDPQAGGSASVVSTVVLPLDEWATVAESDETQDSQSGSLTGAANASRQTQLRVQVRVSLR